MPEEATIIAIFATSFGIGFSGAVQPGPMLALTITETAKRGFWAGPLLVLGHGILELALVIALVLGLSQIIIGDLVTGWIGIIGGIALAVMGIHIIDTNWHRDLVIIPSDNPPNTRQHGRWVLSGVLISLSNPYWLIWWIIIGMPVLLWSLKLGAAGVASFFTGHILADLVWYSLIAFIIVSGKRVIKDTAYRWLLYICGLFLVGLGLFFIASGLNFVL
jgi:threonine/homoserine/homoserine lactone efflux protein